VGVAKSIEREAGREHFYRRGHQPFRLEPKSPVLFYLQRLRDEAHRFAIGGHRKRRSMAIGANPLDEIGGIGAQRKKALLTHFGSARGVASASLGDLQSVEGVSAGLAKKDLRLLSRGLMPFPLTPAGKGVKGLSPTLIRLTRNEIAVNVR
jgi:excinuclease ABC subunit C